MDAGKFREEDSKGRRPEILDLNLETDAPMITLRCQSCGEKFVSYQTSIAGLNIGQHTCPNCHSLNEIWPEDFEAALDTNLSTFTIDEMMLLTAEATRITETWYRETPWADLLNYEGVNLGEGLERELVAVIVQGLQMALKSERAKHGQ